MSIPPEEYDIVIRKGGKFYIEFQQLQDDGQPISLAGKTLKGRVKESFNSTVVLHDLTEANGGLVKVDEANGIFGMLIRSDQSNVTADFGVYDIMAIDNAYPTIESEFIVVGKITYEMGVTQQ